MIRKIKRWLERFSWKAGYDAGVTDTHEMYGTDRLHPEVFTREQLEEAKRISYSDGRKDGLSIARQQATNSLREILKSQNATK